LYIYKDFENSVSSLTRFDKFRGFYADETCRAQPIRLIRTFSQFHGVLIRFFNVLRQFKSVLVHYI